MWTRYSHFVNSHFVNSHLVNVDKEGIDKMEIDEVGSLELIKYTLESMMLSMWIRKVNTQLYLLYK